MIEFNTPIPAKTEITVLSADSPENLSLGFQVWERQGIPLSTSPEEEVRITKKEDLKVGDVVYSYGMLGESIRLTVTSTEEGNSTADVGDNFFCLLEFQNCPWRGPLWLNSAMVSKRGITKTELTTE
jgi:hypothetical protein